MELKGIDQKYSIYGILFSLTNRIQTIGDQEFEEITMKQHFMLVALNLFGTNYPTLKEMGALIGCSYQNVKRMAVSLEKKGYLILENDEQDRRKLKLIPTKKWKVTQNEKQAESEAFMQTLYQGITEEELQIVMETLMRMDQNLGGVIR